jgi:hypothetical protein
MVVLTFFKDNVFSWTYILIIYCCHGNSTQFKKKDIVWVKNKMLAH